MPRTDTPFEFGGHWLGREPGRDAWYRYWREGRRVRRKSTGEQDLELAKARLIEAASRAPAAANDPNAVMMTAVFRHYLDTYIVPRRPDSKRQTRMEADIRRYFRWVIAHMTPLSPNAEGFTAEEFDLLRQRALAKKLFGEGKAPKSIATGFSLIRAALGYAARNVVVEIDGQERVVRMLRYAPTIMTNEAQIAELVGGAVSRPRWFIPTLAECADFIDEIKQEHLFRFVIIALTTWARPTTVLELDVEQQVDFRYGVLDLLPPGRRQTKKRRPVIPLSPTLRGWLEHWNTRYPVTWAGGPIREINDAFRSIARLMGLPEFTPYTLRHFMSSEAIARGAGDGDRSRMLGHLPKAAAATSSWYEHGQVAGYLKSAVTATESVIDDLQGLCGRSLRAPTTLSQGHLKAV